jgi:cytochrome c-type biogenesis protein CcmH
MAQSIEDEARAIARELQCPVCQGLSVADSPSELAKQMRQTIRAKLEAGETRDAITRYFAERYGEGILLAPPREGFTGLVWVVPYVGVIAAVAFLVVKVRRASVEAAPEDRPISPPSPYLEAVDATLERIRDEPLR